jgi:hypothetical protein
LLAANAAGSARMARWMADNLELYGEQLADARTEYYIADGGNLYLINFVVNSKALRPEHKAVIDRLVVPFIANAVRRLGPGKYNLNVVGSASATGPSDTNKDLSAGRAYNAAMYAIEQFEKQQKSDKSLDRITIDPNVMGLGDDVAAQEAKLLHLSRGQVERKQNQFRAAMFRLSAGLIHPPKGATFFIREVYTFKFEKVEQPLPVVLDKLRKVYSLPGVKWVADWGLDKALGDFYKLCDAELPGMGMVAGHMVGYVIPDDVDYCFEVKDYRDTSARYRFSGTEHKDSWGLMQLFSVLSEVKGVVGTVIKIMKGANKGTKTLEGVAKAVDAYKAAAQKFDTLLRRYAGNDAADAVKQLVNLADPYVSQWDALTIPASEWSPFMFHDRGPKHNVRECGGPARRTATDMAFKTAVDIDFAGPVPNNWVDYNAEAKIISPFRWSGNFFGYGQAMGRMELVV